MKGRRTAMYKLAVHGAPDRDYGSRERRPEVKTRVVAGAVGVVLSPLPNLSRPHNGSTAAMILKQ